VNGGGLRAFFVSRWGYVVVGLIAVVLLWVGSGVKSQTPQVARIAHLESIIRCPSCADISIADSESPSAVGLRGEVNRLVHQGFTDQAIEARVEREFPGTLLVPSGGAGAAVFLIPSIVICAGALTFGALLFKRKNRSGRGDDAADLELVRSAQDLRRQDR
jgi:cytochrome c-type biogenesis protein CcmH